MALSKQAARQALIAFQRFGLGAKLGGPVQIGADAKAAVIAEVETLDIALINDPALPNYSKACSDSQKGGAENWRQRELAARVDKHIAVPIGFVERLVVFWSNHFSMSVNKDDTVRGTIGQWERDVIRPNVLGKFSKMLQGTIAHPSMICFLDNQDSIGPNSPIGLEWGVGLNENLAREILELHTVGSDGGYTEQDVTALAKIITGWSFVRGWEADNGYNGGNNQNRGRFIYRGDWHEPGPVTLMGKSYPAVGMQQAQLVLADLAVHPETAEHIAYKLVRHFITDAPTPEMVRPLKKKFLQTKGDLKAVSLALLNLPEAWTAPFTKLRTPYEMTIAQYRALGGRFSNDDIWAFTAPLNALHQTAWECPTPEGWADETPKWLNPDAMRLRLDIAEFHNRVTVGYYEGNVVALADSLFDAALTTQTRDRLSGLDYPNDELVILFTSPEFQRR
jgi:uncharacterized protein (DUF1800 family)